MSPIEPGSLRAWLLATRPQTLTAAFVPVAVGTAVAHAQGGVRVGPALAALLGAFLLQIGTNLANDLFDHEKGADTEERVGPLRAAQAGLLTTDQLRRGMVLSFAAATLAGVYLTVVAGPAVVAIGVLAIASGVAYTGGPYPLGYNGLGDVFVMLFFGFVAVCGTAFVQLGFVPPLAWWASVPVGSLATAILVVNNVRDRETDAKANKRTLAVRFGRGAGVVEYVLLLAMAYLVPALLAWGSADPWLFLPWLTLPWAAALTRNLVRLEGPPLNAILAGTARLLLVHGALFAAALFRCVRC